ncbi:MAG TPA: Ig-like domain-containing protein, partial [Gemmatimonadaceae bacterium]
MSLRFAPFTVRGSAGVVLVAAGALLGACSDSSGTDDGGPPASMEVVGGNGQQGVVGEELVGPLVVKVTDDRGRPVRGQLVNWRVTAGGGSVFAGSALTNREGVAQERWTLGTVAGAAQRVEARAVDDVTGAALVFATFEATAEAGPATTLAPSVEGPLAAPVGAAIPTPITARATDRFDNPVPGVVVTWTA